METDGNSKTPTARKAFLALLAGAVVPAVIVTAQVAIALAATQAAQPDVYSNPGAVWRLRLAAAAVAFFVALSFSAAHALILGLPLMLLGIKLRAIHWWSCIVVGFLIGFIPSAWVSGTDIIGALPMGGLGAIGGLIFWIVWHGPAAARANGNERTNRAGDEWERDEGRVKGSTQMPVTK